MTVDQIKAVNEFLNSLGVDTTKLPVHRIVLDLEVKEVPKLTIEALIYKPEHGEALVKLKEVSPDVTVQWYDPRTPPQLQSQPGDMPVTTYKSPQDHQTKVSVEEGCASDPLVPQPILEFGDNQVLNPSLENTLRALRLAGSPLIPFAEEVTDTPIPQGPPDEEGGSGNTQPIGDLSKLMVPEAVLAEVIDLNKE